MKQSADDEAKRQMPGTCAPIVPSEMLRLERRRLNTRWQTHLCDRATVQLPVGWLLQSVRVLKGLENGFGNRSKLHTSHVAL